LTLHSSLALVLLVNILDASHERGQFLRRQIDRIDGDAIVHCARIFVRGNAFVDVDSLILCVAVQLVVHQTLFGGLPGRHGTLRSEVPHFAKSIDTRREELLDRCQLLHMWLDLWGHVVADEHPGQILASANKLEPIPCQVDGRLTCQVSGGLGHRLDEVPALFGVVFDKLPNARGVRRNYLPPITGLVLDNLLALQALGFELLSYVLCGGLDDRLGNLPGVRCCVLR